jgi:hypothetical protein
MTSTEFGIKDKNNIPNTVSVLGILFQDHIGILCRLVYFNLLSFTVMLAMTLGFEASKQYSPPTLSKSKVSDPSC